MLRPLSKELQDKAIKELYEVPERVEEDIKAIQEWIVRQPYLNAPTDKQWILGFLRGAKFSLQATKEKLDAFYTAMSIMPELMIAKDVFSPTIHQMLRAGIILPLLYPESYVGPRAILVRFNNFDTNISNAENFTAFFNMILFILMVEDNNAMISGIISWIDMKHFPLAVIFQLTPLFFKKFVALLQSILPLRIKGIHSTEAPSLAATIYNMCKGFMGEKLRNRVIIYGKDDFEKFLEVVPRIYLPKEYGGENGNVEDLTGYWVKKVESYSDWFVSFNQYGTDEIKRPVKSKLNGMLGVEGSFRKLNVD